MTIQNTNDIGAAIQAMADANGKAFINPGAPYSFAMTEAGRNLARACGMPEDVVMSLRSHELTAIYSVARKSHTAAIKLCEKLSGVHNPTPATPAPLAPVAAPTAYDTETIERAIQDVLKIADARVDDRLTSIPALVASELAKLAPRQIVVQSPAGKAVTIARSHELFPRVLRYAGGRQWALLVGPAGSGKTTLATQIAKALDLEFYMTAAVQDATELLGYERPHNGEMRMTMFRLAYEFGGVFLFDELDASNANALVSFNAALDNGFCPFPDKVVKMHPDFICIAAANTFGNGADRLYVGRNELDAATLERFTVLNFNYDERLEMELSTNHDWTRYVQAIRAEVSKRKIRHIVSPRASFRGAELIALGDTWEEAAEARLWKGLVSAEKIAEINAVVPMSAFETSIL